MKKLLLLISLFLLVSCEKPEDKLNPKVDFVGTWIGPSESGGHIEIVIATVPTGIKVTNFNQVADPGYTGTINRFTSTSEWIENQKTAIFTVQIGTGISTFSIELKSETKLSLTRIMPNPANNYFIDDFIKQ